MNRIVSEHRKKKEEDPLPAQPDAAGGGDPAVVQQVRAALEQLEPQQREIVLLREYQGLSYQEIAEVLKVPIGTVRSRLFRAKMALRDLLEPSGTPRARP